MRNAGGLFFQNPPPRMTLRPEIHNPDPHGRQTGHTRGWNQESQDGFRQSNNPGIKRVSNPFNLQEQARFNINPNVEVRRPRFGEMVRGPGTKATSRGMPGNLDSTFDTLSVSHAHEFSGTIAHELDSQISIIL